MNEADSIYIAGHRGLVGSAILRTLRERGYTNILTRTSKELDLRDQQATHKFLKSHEPDYVFLAAAQVGGIKANMERPAEFIYDNLAIQTNTIHAAYEAGVKKLCFLGSTCIYPKNSPQPMKEEYLLTGPLEPTNQWYSVAKISGIRLCQAYRQQHGFKTICPQPTNIYGPGDDFDLESSHVMSALIRKFHEAKVLGEEEVTVWGTGEPRREFLYVEDLADALVHLMQHHDSSEIINVGTGEDISIHDLAELIAAVVGYDGDITFDTSKPDGMMRKLTDTTRLRKTGWQPITSLREGVERTYRWFQSNHTETASPEKAGST